jgi:hypothetical protein
VSVVCYLHKLHRGRRLPADAPSRRPPILQTGRAGQLGSVLQNARSASTRIDANTRTAYRQPH